MSHNAASRIQQIGCIDGAIAPARCMFINLNEFGLLSPILIQESLIRFSCIADYSVNLPANTFSHRKLKR